MVNLVEMNKRTLFLVFGMVLAGIGFYALFLMLVGVQISFLVWIDGAGMLYGFLGRLLLILVGAVSLVMGITDWKFERDDIEQYRQSLKNTPKDVSSN
jgi:type III secretory pathway component EscU